MKLLQPTKNNRKTQGFEANPNNGIYGPAGHDGVDYGPITPGVEGDDLFAVDLATITSAAFVGGYGNLIKYRLINFPNVELGYGHCKEFLAKVGDTVHMGDSIAKLGNTHTMINGKPTSTSPHVHVMMWIDGKKVNVEPYLSLSYNDFMNELEQLRKDHEDFFKAYGVRNGEVDDRFKKQSDRINESVQDAKDGNKVLAARVEKTFGKPLVKLSDEEKQAAIGK